MHLDPFTIEKIFFDLDKTFKTLHDLKEKFIIFNQSKFDNYNDIEKELNSLINEYKVSDQTIFKHLA